MKNFVLFFWLLLLSSVTYSQEKGWQFKMGDKWFNEHQGLKVGDTLPDIALGNVINNNTGKTRFSEFKGKVIILDFWTMTCKSCIAAFPKMEQLQEKYGDKIQIFTVNNSDHSVEQVSEYFETQVNEINRRINTKSSGTGQPPRKMARMSTLPSIFFGTSLRQFFPARFVPHHIMIDANGVIRSIGAETNTNEKKIDELLAGKPINYVKDENVTPSFNKTQPYYPIANKTIDPSRYNSLFTRFNNEYAARTGGAGFNQIDSAAGTIRNTWVNIKVQELFIFLFADSLTQLWEQSIINPYGQYISYQVKDTLRYTDNYLNGSLTDEQFVKSRVCYEQITPIIFHESKRKQLMLEDLRSYFGKLYNVDIKVERKEMDCYVLIRTNSNINIKAQSEQWISPATIVKNGIEMVEWKSTNLKSAIFTGINNSWSRGAKWLIDDTILNETGISGKVAITLPKYSSTFEEFRQALKPYGLDIIKAKRSIPFIVFREKDYTAKY